MLLISFDDLCGVRFVVDVILVSDGDEGGGGRMDGEVEVATDVGVSAFDDLEMIFGGKCFDMLVRCSGGD